MVGSADSNRNLTFSRQLKWYYIIRVGVSPPKSCTEKVV